MVVITEMWLQNCIPDDCLAPEGYEMFICDRDSRGGGVAIIVKNSVVTSQVQSNVPETVWCKISLSNTVYLVGVVYRPPTTAPEYLDELNNFLCTHVNGNTRLILTGDFNLPHINWDAFLPGQVEIDSGEKMLEIMFAHNLIQIVNEYTRITPASRSVLDLVFLSNKIRNYEICVEGGVSDHRLVFVTVPLNVSRARTYKTVQVKDYANADDTSILDMLGYSFSQFQHVSELETVEEMWQRFKSIVKHCVDKFIPSRAKKTKKRNPWITRDIIHKKRKLKRLRRRRNRDFEEIARARRELKKDLIESKRAFFSHKLSTFIKHSPSKFWLYMSDRRGKIEELKRGNEIVTQIVLILYFSQYLQDTDAALKPRAQYVTHLNRWEILLLVEKDY